MKRCERDGRVEVAKIAAQARGALRRGEGERVEV